MKKFIRAGFKAVESDNYTETAIHLLSINKDVKEFTAKGEIRSIGTQHNSSISKCFCTLYVANKQLIILLGDGTEARKYDINKVQVIRPKSDEFRFKHPALPGGYIKVDDMTEADLDNFKADIQSKKIKATQLFSVLLRFGAKEIDKL